MPSREEESSPVLVGAWWMYDGTCDRPDISWKMISWYPAPSNTDTFPRASRAAFRRAFPADVLPTSLPRTLTSRTGICEGVGKGYWVWVQ